MDSINSTGFIGEDLLFLAASRSPKCTLRLDKHLVGYFTIQFMDTGSIDLAFDNAWQHLDSGQGWFWPAYP
ncbi:MAG: hypothetical protein H7Z41_01970, partial [Cytophagales bacterium]|nr:hypothetical protein [Armatimonadota bacterium]